MMTLAAATLLLAPLQYGFEPGAKFHYETVIKFEGFIPILGGNEGTVLVEMGVDVDGLQPTKERTARAANEIKRFKVTFNGAVLPLDATSVQPYFPRTTITLEKSGKIVESDAPNVQLPVRLPGLDVKRFPDVTYVPVEFPSGEPENGVPWKFSRKFGESEIHYTCKVAGEKNGAVIVEVSILQEYELLENAAMEVVKEEKDAERRVKTIMTGQGIVLFDTKRGAVVKAEMVNDAESDVTKLADGSRSKRKLRTTFSLSLKEEAAKTPRPREDWFGNAWTVVSDTARRVWESTLGWWTVTKLAFLRQVSRTSGSGG